MTNPIHWMDPVVVQNSFGENFPQAALVPGWRIWFGLGGFDDHQV